LYKRALAIYQGQAQPQIENVALGLRNLAAIYYSQGRYQEAQPLLSQATEIAPQTNGSVAQ
jgi:tetratricopeptide (TPR) repeat protein